MSLCSCMLDVDSRSGNGKEGKGKIRLWAVPRYYCLHIPTSATLWSHCLLETPPAAQLHPGLEDMPSPRARGAADPIPWPPTAMGSSLQDSSCWAPH